MIFSKDDVWFCVDLFEEKELEKLFLGSENTERRLVKTVAILPVFCKSGP